uniref:hypothetical protein n=1 Tax=Castellaniella defragrans TaxID=75697 RepID=UPI003341B02E
MKKRVLLSCGLAFMAALGGFCVHAAAPGAGPAASWTDWRWGVRQDFDLPGSRLTQQPFEADTSPAQAARRLVGRRDMAFERLMVVDGGIVLSGMRGGAHWFGWLRSGPRGTRGMVSVLTPLPAVRLDAGDDMPEGARPLVRVAQREGQARLVTSAYVYSATAASPEAAIRRSLARAGWQPTEASWPGAEAWRRPGTLLQVRVQPQGMHSIIWTWRREEAQ